MQGLWEQAADYNRHALGTGPDLAKWSNDQVDQFPGAIMPPAAGRRQVRGEAVLPERLFRLTG